MASLQDQEADVAPPERPGARSTSAAGRSALGLLLAGYLFLDVVAGAPGSPLVPPLPRGVSPPAWSAQLARWVRLDHLSRTQLTVLAVAVLAVLVGAFAVAMREAWLGRIRLPAVLLTMAVSLGLSVVAPVLLSRDVFSYVDYGRIFTRYHANPYVVPPDAFPSDPFVSVTSPEWVHTRMLYGPLFGLISAAVVKSASSPGTEVLLFKIVAGGAVALAAAFAAMAGRSRGPGRMVFGAAVVGLNPVLVVHTVGGAHNDALIAALLAAALAAALGRFRASRPGGGAQRRSAIDPGALLVTALLTLAALVKAVVAPALIIWVWSCFRTVPRSSRAKTIGAHAAAVVALAAALFAPFYAGWRTITPLGTLASVRGWASGTRLVARGAEALAMLVGGASLGRTASKAVVGAFLLGFIFLFLRVARRARPEAPADQLGTVLLLFALSAPYFVPWYAAWFLPFLPLLADEVLVLVGLTAAGLLALTGVPAEPGAAPALWNDMMLGVHYGAGPIMLALFVVAAARTIRRPPERWPPPDPRTRERTPGAIPDRGRSERSG